MDWAGWATFGFVATVVLTAVMVGAQLAGWSRLDIPLMLGSIFIGPVDRARVVGFFLHLGAGQTFALLYAAAFSLIGSASWMMGAVFGAVHGLVALTVIVPLLAGINPRMATERAGPELGAVLEPPGVLGLNYGVQTPAVAFIAHLAYGAILGGFLQPR
jgi:hypothetical protein